MFHQRASQRGFTLTELLTALAVSGVLATIGMPAMGSFHSKTVIDSQVQSLSSAMRRAREEAITRGELVTVCAMAPATTDSAEPHCLARGKDWSAGWIVFIDRGDRGVIGVADRIVSVQQAPTQAGVVGTSRYITYRPTGVLLSGMGHYRVLAPGQQVMDQDQPGAALICLNRTGRPRVADEPDCD